LRLGKGKQHELKGDVIKVISHCQQLSKTFRNVFCPRYKIVKLGSKFKSNVGKHGFHPDKPHEIEF
jgi:hypothetical protein